MRHRFQTEQWVPYGLDRVFAFFADPANLPRLMPRWQRARIETATMIAPPPPPAGMDTGVFAGIEAGTGSRLTLTIRPFPFSPVRLPWVALIEDFRWMEGFCDVQVKGPFTFWRHCHSVEACAERASGRAGTMVRDAVEYELPLGVLGDLANRIAVRRQIGATFRYRQRRTLELLAETAAADEFPSVAIPQH